MEPKKEGPGNPDYDRGLNDVKHGEYNPPDGKGIGDIIGTALFGRSEADINYEQGQTEGKKS